MVTAPQHHPEEPPHRPAKAYVVVEDGPCFWAVMNIHTQEVVGGLTREAADGIAHACNRITALGMAQLDGTL